MEVPVGSTRVGSGKYGGGPHGLGDPLDRSLRKVEIDILIPKKMRDKARDEKCSEEVSAFSKCCKSSSVFMVIACRKENTALKDCLNKWYQDEEFKNSCKEEYLDERSEFRRTGTHKNHHDKINISHNRMPFMKAGCCGQQTT